MVRVFVCVCVYMHVFFRVLRVPRHRVILSVGHGFKLLTPCSHSVLLSFKMGGSQQDAKALQWLVKYRQSLCNCLVCVYHSQNLSNMRSIVVRWNEEAF